jgi:hypothetical protein
LLSAAAQLDSMETKVDLMAAEIDLAGEKVDPASAEVDFVGEKLDSAATGLSLALENFDSASTELVLVGKLRTSVVGCRGRAVECWLTPLDLTTERLGVFVAILWQGTDLFHKSNSVRLYIQNSAPRPRYN